MFFIEDELHAETMDGTFAARQDAVAELERLANIPWDEVPNRAPCQSWRTCGRTYVVIEWDDSGSPEKELSRAYVLEVSSAGVTWLDRK